MYRFVVVVGIIFLDIIEKFEQNRNLSLDLYCIYVLLASPTIFGFFRRKGMKKKSLCKYCCLIFAVSIIKRTLIGKQN